MAEKQPQKEKKERKRKADTDGGRKSPKKSKKSASNIPTNVMSGTGVSSKEGLNAISLSSACGSVLPDQNGSTDTTKNAQEVGSARSGPSVGTSSTVNNVESVTSTPARGDTAGVGA